MELKEKIEQYIKVTGHGQLSREEINHMINIVKQKPINMLIFGTGYDSSIWVDVNKGKTVFLEHQDRFIAMGKKHSQEVYKVEYTTHHKDYMKIINSHDKLKMNLQDNIVNEKWDVIFVDSPVGNSHGRMQSIFTASRLGLKNCECHIFIHDCDREIEKVYSDKFMADFKLIKQVRKLRHYKT